MENTIKSSITYKSNGKGYLIDISCESNGLAMKLTELDNSNIISSIYKGKFNFNELKKINF